MKKAFIITLSLVFLPATAWAAFWDANPSDLYHGAIDYVEKENIVTGYSDGSYRGHEKIKREEFAAIMARTLFSEQIDSCRTTSFLDVLPEMWYTGPICTLERNDLIEGFDGNRFGLEENINFVEMAKILSIAQGQPESSSLIWFEDYVRYLESQNAIPLTVKTFDHQMSREEMAEIIERLWAGISDRPSHTFESLNGTGSISDQNEAAAFFSDTELYTDTSIASIPLDEIVGGGPKKDGIPALSEPLFEPLEQADEWVNDNELGILYQKDGMVRFYPYAILVWHEIVNDTVLGQDIAVTFCPLCGSAIVFDRKVDGESLTFGVSGKLWESNLLMYSHGNETLWSQFLGEAVVGGLTGKKLTILDSDILTFGELKANHPNTQVLSRLTGHNRKYGQSPYGNYETNNQLYFDVSNTDDSFQLKTLFIISNELESAFGFHRADLLANGQAQLEVDGMTIEAIVQENGTIQVTNLESGQNIPTYVGMWFSWVAHGQKERVVWSVE